MNTTTSPTELPATHGSPSKVDNMTDAEIAAELQSLGLDTESSFRRAHAILDAIIELRADYGRLRLMDAALALCGGKMGATHMALREKVLAAQEKIGMPNWRYLELCQKCKGCGQVYAAYLLESSLCDCHDGYVLEANACVSDGANDPKP